MGEIWKDVPNYEGYYKISNLGRVKSAKRIYSNNQFGGELILNNNKNGLGYFQVGLSVNGVTKTKLIHVLMAVCYLNHKPDGTHKLVVNHINFDKSDNRAVNLEIVTNRENTNQKHIKSISKYTGVTWSGYSWLSRIYINKKNVYLGRFKSEYDAHLAYQEALNKIT